MSKFLKFIVTLFLLIAIGVTAAIIVPPMAGVQTTIVDSQLMDTNLPMGSVTYAKEVYVTDVAPGDRILRQSDVSTYEYVVQTADASTGAFRVQDAYDGTKEPEDIQILNTASRVVMTIPYIGYVVYAMHSIEGIIILALIVLLMIILFILSELWRKDDDDDDEDDEDAEERELLIPETEALDLQNAVDIKPYLNEEPTIPVDERTVETGEIQVSEYESEASAETEAADLFGEAAAEEANAEAAAESDGEIVPEEEAADLFGEAVVEETAESAGEVITENEATGLTAGDLPEERTGFEIEEGRPEGENLSEESFRPEGEFAPEGEIAPEGDVSAEGDLWPAGEEAADQDHTAAEGITEAALAAALGTAVSDRFDADEVASHEEELLIEETESPESAETTDASDATHASEEAEQATAEVLLEGEEVAPIDPASVNTIDMERLQLELEAALGPNGHTEEEAGESGEGETGDAEISEASDEPEELISETDVYPEDRFVDESAETVSAEEETAGIEDTETGAADVAADAQIDFPDAEDKSARSDVNETWDETAAEYPDAAQEEFARAGEEVPEDAGSGILTDAAAEIETADNEEAKSEPSLSEEEEQIFAEPEVDEALREERYLEAVDPEDLPDPEAEEFYAVPRPTLDEILAQVERDGAEPVITKDSVTGVTLVDYSGIL